MYYICGMLLQRNRLFVKFYFLFVLLAIGVGECYAKDVVVNEESVDDVCVVFDVGNQSFFDNREVRSPYQYSQTLFGSHLGSEVGVQFGPNAVLAGIQVIKDFGADDLAVKDFTFYYHYASGHFSGAFGSFPRRRLRRELPDIFISDSLRYYSPTLHGALIQYTGESGYAEFYCNWINKQGVGQREVFELVFDGCFSYKRYYAGWNVQLMHFSVPRPSDGAKVYDKLMINPHCGVMNSDLYWLDAFSMEVGLMLSLNRDRNDMLWKTPMGFLGDVRLRKARFELRERVYVGNPQFSDYEIYGDKLHRGDPYYRSELYSRTDFCFYLLNNVNVQCYVNASFHYTEQCVDNSQQVILRITPDLDGLKLKPKKMQIW